jgi:hypothetical protein
MEKLYSLLNNLILEVASRSEIESAIDKHQTVRIYYEGDDTEVRGWRWIEPYVYGVSKAGNPIVRAFQIEGVTDTEQPAWKTFRADKISRWIRTPKVFFQPISDRDPSVPRYRENGDDSMITIYKQAQF